MPYRKKWRSLRLAAFVRQEWPSFLMVTAGTVIFTIGLLSLTIPYRYPDAGVSGLAVLANYAAGINPAWVIITCNVGLLIWGWRELSPRFVIWTMYTIVLLSLLLKVLEGFPALPLQDRLLVAILAGVVKGLGVGLSFRASSSLGGTDIIVMSLRKRFGIEVGKYNFYINIGILGLAVLVVGLEASIFGLVSIYASALVTDNFLQSFDRRKQIMVVTADPMALNLFIRQELQRGVTILQAEGGYTSQPRPVVLSVLSSRQVMEVKRFLMEHDPHAFMMVGDASEVLGKGFKALQAS